MYILEYIQDLGFESYKDALCVSNDIDKLKDYVAEDCKKLYDEEWKTMRNMEVLDLNYDETYTIRKIKEII